MIIWLRWLRRTLIGMAMGVSVTVYLRQFQAESKRKKYDTYCFILVKNWTRISRTFSSASIGTCVGEQRNMHHRTVFIPKTATITPGHYIFALMSFLAAQCPQFAQRISVRSENDI